MTGLVLGFSEANMTLLLILLLQYISAGKYCLKKRGISCRNDFDNLICVTLLLDSHIGFKKTSFFFFFLNREKWLWIMSPNLLHRKHFRLCEPNLLTPYVSFLTKAKSARKLALRCLYEYKTWWIKCKVEGRYGNNDQHS